MTNRRLRLKLGSPALLVAAVVTTSSAFQRSPLSICRVRHPASRHAGYSSKTLSRAFVSNAKHDCRRKRRQLPSSFTNVLNSNSCDNDHHPSMPDLSIRREPNEALRESIATVASILLNSPVVTHNSSSIVLVDSHQRAGSTSIVHIIGTGLTPTLESLPFSSLHILSQADVVLHDSLGLSRHEIGRIVPTHCEIICVGKRGDDDTGKSWKQRDIDDLLVRIATNTTNFAEENEYNNKNFRTSNDETDSNHSYPTIRQQKKIIVRLKGGDPFLFGRTRSEIDALRSHNIPYTYTPGVSSCIAGPHLGGIPLTDASLNCQSFSVFSGTDAFGRGWGWNVGSGKGENGYHDSQGKDFFEASNVDVLVFLMIGHLDKLETLCRFLTYGQEEKDYANVDSYNGEECWKGKRRKWNKDTPCAIIQNAGGRSIFTSRGIDEKYDNNTVNDEKCEPLPIQRVWRSTLDKIVPMIRKEDESCISVSPAVFVVGAVSTLDLSCNYFIDEI